MLAFVFSRVSIDMKRHNDHGNFNKEKHLIDGLKFKGLVHYHYGRTWLVVCRQAWCWNGTGEFSEKENKKWSVSLGLVWTYKRLRSLPPQWHTSSHKTKPTPTRLDLLIILWLCETISFKLPQYLWPTVFHIIWTNTIIFFCSFYTELIIIAVYIMIPYL